MSNNDIATLQIELTAEWPKLNSSNYVQAKVPADITWREILLKVAYGLNGLGYNINMVDLEERLS